MKKALILLSGGLDSTTCLALAIEQGFKVTAVSFRYGQKHIRELEYAKKNAENYNVEKHIFINLELDKIGGSSLTSSFNEPNETSIPNTYVPGRNTLFLSYAASIAETLNIADIFIGVNAIDYSGYPDCRPEFIKAMEKTINLGTKKGVLKEISFVIHTPLINLTKSEIIQKGLERRVDYSQTTSCYFPIDNLACGICDSCKLRKAGFEKLNKKDPIAYKNLL